MLTENTIICPYCVSKAKLVTGLEVYPRIRSSHSKWYYKCPNCDAYVGCHPKTQMPLGTLADAELRTLRSKVHKKFDPIWKAKKVSRRQAYQKLARALNLDLNKCHIGMFNIEQCNEALEFLKTF